ncbi:MAG TPA: hypothetical protein DHN33_08595 [Eubacteriaceae bacterium]|nr:hypothetical protein [Eubacteriaceae bacterium]
MRIPKSKNRIRVKLIISLVIALSLWAYVINDQDPRVDQRYNNIPVDLQGQEVLSEKGLTILNTEDLSVDVTVNGRTSTLYNFNWRDMTASVDLSEIDEVGRHNIVVEVEGIPPEVDLVRITPSNIIFDVDRKESQSEKVDLQLEGEPAEGFALVDLQSEPEFVQLEGAAQRLEEVDRVIGQLQIEGIKEDLQKNIELVAVNEQGEKVENINISPGQINVTALIGEVFEANVEVVTEGTRDNGARVSVSEVRPDTVQLAKRGNVGDIEAIQTEAVDISQVSDGERKELALNLPEGVYLLNEDERVTVTFLLEDQNEQVYEFEKINVENRPEGFQIDETQLERNVRLVLTGEQEQLDVLSAESINVYIDLSEVTEAGTQEFEVLIETIDGIEVSGINPSTVMVDISESQEEETPKTNTDNQ